MFLHSGASLHGHKYSSSSQPDAPRRSPLLRAALTHNSPPTNTLASSTTTPAASGASSHPSPAAAAAAAAALAASTTTVATAASPASPIGRSVSVTNGMQARLAGTYRPRTHIRRASDGHTDLERLPEPLVRFQEPVVVDQPLALHQPTLTLAAASRTPERIHDDESGFSGSEDSYSSDHATASSVISSTTKPSRRRRPSRKSTTFLFAHPAPKLRTKKQLLQRIRPTLVVQLQRVYPNRRPLPAIDVYPSSLIAGNVVAPRFSKRFPRLFGVKGELGLHDTILVRSEDYGPHPHHSESSDTEDDANLEHRSLLAVLSPVRRDNQEEIVLEDGTVWKASQLPNGSYDFVHVDDHGFTSTVRWVRRCSSKTRPRSATISPASTGTNGTLEAPTVPVPAEMEPKFIFSIIDPGSRRHPILATLTKSTLDILDQYTTVSPLSNRYPPSRSHPESTINEEDESGTDTTPSAPLKRERTVVQVDDALREFISITAIWVSLRSGFVEANNTGAAATCPATAAIKESASQSRTSGSVRRRRSPPQSDRSQSPSPEAKSRAQGQRSPTPGELPRSPSLPTKATSTGAAFVQRRKHLHLSDTNDNERRSFSGVRRSKTLSRFSGDFTSLGSRTQQPPSPTNSASPPEASWVEVSQAAKVQRHVSMGAVAAARATMPVSPSAPMVSDVRRSQSAHYHRNPLMTSTSPPKIASPKGAKQGQGRDELRSLKRADSVIDKKGRRSRWRRMGNWFKKIGGH